ncbi:unnamed protein product [Allacma fusca]|uniref:Uncharacterized protein n=1 Tax=Allacma fusca TaxID=39272 RepID=A0A8J2JJ25_9HEXA|nr:unnamed protein product [Allacma fusca]
MQGNGGRNLSFYAQCSVCTLKSVLKIGGGVTTGTACTSLESKRKVRFLVKRAVLLCIKFVVEMEEAPGKDEKESENLELKSWLSCSLKAESLAPHLIDEIALEGLDGITLQALQVRLTERPGMTMEITDKSMNQIWNVVRRIKGIEMYELPESRNDLVMYRRADYVDDRGKKFQESKIDRLSLCK